MHDLLRSNPKYHQHVKIIPQRDEHGIGLNVFQRFSHYDTKRRMSLDYDGDPPSTCYRKGDFIVQCTGLATAGLLRSPVADKKENFLFAFLRIRGYETNFRLECVEHLIDESREY